MKPLNKYLVSEVIRLTIKFHATGDIDLLDAKNAASKRLDDNNDLSDVVESLARYCHYQKASSAIIYNILETLGYTLVDLYEE